MDPNISLVFETIGQIKKSLQCSICLELLNDPHSTRCNHQFCSNCIRKVIDDRRNKQKEALCPLCKNPITKRSLTANPRLKEIVIVVQRLNETFKKDASLPAKQSPSPSNVKQENRSSRQACTKGKTSGSPNKQSPFEWTQVKPRRKEESHGKDRNPRASNSGEWCDGGGNSKRSNNKEKGSITGSGNRQTNFAGRNRRKTPNSKFSRSVSDNTNNRAAKQTGISDENSRRKTASEGGAYRR